ncbi:MAG: response regulator transcription factor [Xenococcaceae cyanobacterium MO_188.B29]|nr:response regulator transcription factor [Xenococcaceae cyanobacterium MO_188.B29]
MKKVLVVDDDSILRTVLKHTLEQQGYQVKTVHSGKEALAAFTQDIPDIVVSDVSMPEMDGFEFCRQLRSQPSGQLVPFIFLSAKTDLDHRVEGHSSGADDYLTKPFEMKELLAKIEGMLERSRRIHSEIVHLMQQLANSHSVTQSIISSPLSSANPNNWDELKNKPEPLPLTPAEERVFWEVIQGFTNKQISELLYISPRTVQTHLSNILNKLNLENRTQLVRFAYEQGYEKAEKQ